MEQAEAVEVSVVDGRAGQARVIVEGNSSDSPDFHPPGKAPPGATNLVSVATRASPACLDVAATTLPPTSLSYHPQSRPHVSLPSLRSPFSAHLY